MKCLNCEYCYPDDIDPETLNVTYFCIRYQKEVNPISYCFEFRNKDCYYE